MKKYPAIITICLIFFIGSCTPGASMQIIPADTPEEELNDRAQELMEKESGSEPEKPAQQGKETHYKEKKAYKEVNTMPEKTAPYQKAGLIETRPYEEKKAPEKSMISIDYTQEALINLLEKKGLISRSELLQEIKRLRQGR